MDGIAFHFCGYFSGHLVIFCYYFLTISPFNQKDANFGHLFGGKIGIGPLVSVICRR
jgi:hypothetical protein